MTAGQANEVILRYLSLRLDLLQLPCALVSGPCPSPLYKIWEQTPTFNEISI